MEDAALDSIFSALADPTRRAILARLASGEVTVSELAAPFAMSGPAVSKHLKVLERAGLIARSRDAQRRPCSLTAEPLKHVANWVTHYEHFWTESFDRLDAYLQATQPTSRTKASRQSKSKASAAHRRNRNSGTTN